MRSKKFEFLAWWKISLLRLTRDINAVAYACKRSNECVKYSIASFQSRFLEKWVPNANNCSERDIPRVSVSPFFCVKQNSFEIYLITGLLISSNWNLKCKLIKLIITECDRWMRNTNVKKNIQEARILFGWVIHFYKCVINKVFAKAFHNAEN